MGKDIKYSALTLLSSKINVGIIGAGRAGIIKAKHFINKGVHVHILAKEKREEITELIKNSYVKLEINKYYKDFILDKHIIIIAVDDEKVAQEIRNDCNELYKIFIDSTNFKEGSAIVPVQRETNNLVIAVNSKGGNPKGSILVANKIKDKVIELDSFIEFTTKIRNEVKNRKDIKKDVLNFIYDDDFIFFFNKNKAEDVLRLFYGKIF